MNEYWGKFSLLLLFFGVWRKIAHGVRFFFYSKLDELFFFEMKGIHKWITGIEWDSFIFLLRLAMNGSRNEFSEYRAVQSPPPALFWLENVFHFSPDMKGVTSNDFRNKSNYKLMNLILYNFDYHWEFRIWVYVFSNNCSFCLIL